MTTRADIVTEARTWVGVPWRHTGRNRQGIDCAGLVVVVAKALGVADYDHTGYTRKAIDHSILDHFGNNMRQKPICECKMGDVLLFRDTKYPFHVGMLGWRYDAMSLIHGYAERRKVVEEQYLGEWPSRALACFEFYGLEDA